MPTYEYRCPDGHEFEQFVQKISDAQGQLPCPTCGVVAARRMSAGGGLLFKGSGFYITDYGKDGKKDQRAAASGEKGAKSETAGKSEKAEKGVASAPAAGGDAGGSSNNGAASGSKAPTAPPSSTPAAPSAGSPPKSGPEK